MYQKIYKAGLFVYLLLFILSLVFYKERIIILDDAYYLFNIVKDARLRIEHFRYIALVTQIFPLLAMKLSLPLQAVAMAYSAGFVIYYFICYLLCGWLKEYKLGLVLLLVNILFSTHTFYWMLSELMLGLALLLVLMAFLNSAYTNNKVLQIIVLLIAIPTLAFAHPLLLIPFSFALLFMILDATCQMTIKKAALPMGMYIGVLVLKAVFFKEGYEAQSMQGAKNFIILFPNYLNLYSNRTFLANCISKYHWIPIVFAMVSGVYIYRKQWLKLLVFCPYAIGFVLLVNISYPHPVTHEFYIENLYTPLAFLLALPFVFDVLPAIPNMQVRYAFVSVLCVTCLVRIYTGHIFYTQRLDWQRKYLKEHGHEKLIVDAKYLPMNTLLMLWGSPYEFWLLSTIEQQKTASIVFTEHMGEVEWGKEKQGSMMTTWGPFAYEHLPVKYFTFTDTQTHYRVIK